MLARTVRWPKGSSIILSGRRIQRRQKVCRSSSIGSPARAGRRQVRRGAGDASAIRPGKNAGIGRIGRAAQSPHRRRCRVRVRCRDQHAIGGNAGLLAGRSPWPGRAARGASCSYRRRRSPAASHPSSRTRQRAKSAVVDLRRAGLEEPPLIRTGKLLGETSTAAAPAARSCAGRCPARGLPISERERRQRDHQGQERPVRGLGSLECGCLIAEHHPSYVSGTHSGSTPSSRSLRCQSLGALAFGLGGWRSVSALAPISLAGGSRRVGRRAR